MIVSDKLKEIAKQLLDRYRKDIEDTGHSASGNLQKSSSYKCTIDETTFEVWFSLPEYWIYLENGTKPHFPPVSEIEKWITVKRIVPKPIKNRIPTTKQLAFLIAREISVNGTKETKLLQNTIDSSDDLIKLMVDELVRQLEEQIKEEEI